MAQCKVSSYYSTRKRVYETKILKQKTEADAVSKISDKLKILGDDVKCEVQVETAVSGKKSRKGTAGPISDTGEPKAKKATKKTEAKAKKAKPKTNTRTGKAGLKGKSSTDDGNSDIRKVFENQKVKSTGIKQEHEEGIAIPKGETKEVLRSKPVGNDTVEQSTEITCKSETLPAPPKLTLKGQKKDTVKTSSVEVVGNITAGQKLEPSSASDDSVVQTTDLNCKPEIGSAPPKLTLKGQKKNTAKPSAPEIVANITDGQKVEPSSVGTVSAKELFSAETIPALPKETSNNSESAVLSKKDVSCKDVNLSSLKSPQKKQHLDLNPLDSGSPPKKARTALTSNISSKEGMAILGTSHRRLDLTIQSPTKLSSSTEQSSKVTVTQLDKSKILNSGRLDTLKERLAKFNKSLSALKDGENNKCKITSVISTGGGQSSQAEEKQTDIRRSVPAAYERFHSLAIAGPPSLTLPYKYKWLSEIFRCADTVVSMLHNRKEICSFLKLKNSVQEMTKRNFTKNHLCQIKAVFPLAYFYTQEKFHSSSLINPKPGVSQYQLVISPNLKTYMEELNEMNENMVLQTQNSKVNKSQSRNNVNKQSPNDEPISTPNSLSQMNPSILVERKKIFDSYLLNIVKKHHQNFLARLNPPITVPFEKLSRWHHKFPLDSVPDIEPSPLPEPIDVPKCHTAMDILNKIKGTVSEKVEKALQSVAEKSLSDATDKSKVGEKGIIKTGLLKGISNSLLQRIRAREASKIVQEMTMPPEEKKRKQMIERLPEMVRIIRNYFITARKAAISVEDATQKIMDSYHSALPEEDVKAHIQLLAEIFPKWLNFVTIPKGVFLKIDKNMDINIMLDTISKK